MISEFKKVIAREKFKLSSTQQTLMTNFITRLSAMVKVRSRFRVVKEDPSDDVVLRTAYDGKADFIVSGDDHLLALREFKGIKIVTANEMLEILKK